MRLFNDHKQQYFIDTEFYGNGLTIDLISIAIVAGPTKFGYNKQHELYLCNREARLHDVEQWTRDNVFPHLPNLGDQAWVSKEEMRTRIRDLVIHDSGAEFWGYYCAYDWVVFCQLFGGMLKLPHWFPKHCMDLKQLANHMEAQLPRKPADAHHALADARWNMEVYDTLRALR